MHLARLPTENDIQNKINHLLRSGKRLRVTRDYDNIPPFPLYNHYSYFFLEYSIQELLLKIII